MLFLDQILNEIAIGIYRQKIVVLCKVRRFISALILHKFDIQKRKARKRL